MALRMEIQTTAGGSFTEVSLSTYKLHSFKLTVSYTHPAKLSFKAAADGHTFPLGIRNFIRFWDDAGTTPDGSAQSATNPMFEGFLRVVNPGGATNEVDMVAFDPTAEIGEQFKIMSLPWLEGVGTAPPLPSPLATPRLIFNSKIDNDDDWVFERAHNATVGTIVQTILSDQFNPLEYWNAATSPAWNTAEIDAMNFELQEKEVFETETVRSGIDRLVTRWHPTRKLLWRPGVRQWRFPDLTASARRLLVLNTTGGNVLSLDIARSIEGRYTAIRFYGPTTSTTTVLTLGGGGLTDISDTVSLQSNPPTCCNVSGLHRWQITDPLLRSIANRLPESIIVQTGDYVMGITDQPVLLGYWPNDTEIAKKGWRVIPGWYWEDKTAGKIALFPSGAYATRYNPSPTSGQPNYENPTDIQLIYGLASSPLQVRVPTTGYEGTAYTVANIFNEQLIYDEMLAAFYERYTVTTTATRLAKYAQLGRYLLDQTKNILYTGGATLEGIQYDYLWLDRRINLSAVDENGSVVTTGWESIDAFLTDVEYDFEERITTLTFNSDQAELIGVDIDQAKTMLRIRALAQRQLPVFVTFKTDIRGRKISDKQQGFSQQWSVHETTFRVQGGGTEFYDAQTGEVEQ
jgi:hypothetical protein